MALLRILNLLALSSLAVVLFSTATPANALVTDAHLARRSLPHHGLAAKRKRQSTGRCTKSTNNTTSNAAAAPAVVGGGSSSSSTPSGNTTPTSSPAAAPSSTPPASAPSGPGNSPNSPGIPTPGQPKVGLAWPNGPSPQLSEYITPKVGYLYSWDVYRPSNLPGNVEFMPMLWGTDPQRIQNFQNTVVPGYSKYVLGFNECNEPGQSNLSPGDAAAAWLQYIEPLHYQGFYLIGPSTSSNPNGLQWTKDFLAACTGCHVDALPIHYYDISADGFKQYVTNFHETFQMDIWPTEFDCQNFNGGAQCSDGEIWAFFQSIIPWMDAQPWIPAYFAFGMMQNLASTGVNPANALMDQNTGDPTSLGYTYINDSW